MNKILVGSAAIKQHFPDFKREPKDQDYIVKEKVEFDENDNLVVPIFFNYCKSEVASPEQLLTLKLSHIFWDVNWDKHMWDIQFLLGKGIDYDFEWLLELREHWVKHYKGLYRSNLKLSKEEFFDNAINTGYEHDYIHTLINPVPMYTEVLAADGKGVELDGHKFMNLTYDDKLKFIQEEVMVMAWERFSKLYYKEAYHKMLKKFIRNHVPIFAFDFTICNYIPLLDVPFNFIEKINLKLEKNEQRRNIKT
jgi:hypothetical protein